MHGSTPGCVKVAASGAIDALFHSLRLWPTEKWVVLETCIALKNLAYNGNASVKIAMRGVSDCESLLRAAHASCLDGCFEGVSNAAWVLDDLGLGSS